MICIQPTFVRYVRPNDNDDVYVREHSNKFCIVLSCVVGRKGIYVWADPHLWTQQCRFDRREDAYFSDYEYMPTMLVPHRMIKDRLSPKHPNVETNQSDLITAWKRRLISWQEGGTSKVPSMIAANSLSLMSLASILRVYNEVGPLVNLQDIPLHRNYRQPLRSSCDE